MLSQCIVSRWCYKHSGGRIYMQFTFLNVCNSSPQYASHKNLPEYQNISSWHFWNLNWNGFLLSSTFCINYLINLFHWAWKITTFLKRGTYFYKLSIHYICLFKNQVYHWKRIQKWGENWWSHVFLRKKYQLLLI